MTSRLRPVPALLVLCLAAWLAPPSGAAAAPAPTYTNPVSASFADTFADPAVIRGKDGWWYAFGTSDPLREGEGVPHRLPIARSTDLVSWTYVGDAFTDATLPSWAEPDAGLWAPDIRYVDGEYRLYYVVTETTVTDRRGDNAIGMATAPTPTGPWTDSGAPVVGPREGNGGFLWTFDPAAVTDTDGSQWLFYGSYNGGVFVSPLSADGRRTDGPATMVAIDNKFEGSYVVRHGRWWYLFASTANCCAGPTTGYTVQVGRSRDLRGPYVDAQGQPLLASRAGGTPTLVQNGNRWIGAGHNAIATDVTGQQWIVYHAIDPADPYLDGTDGINERPMLIDRLDWVGGWPVVRGGRGPSSTPQHGPVTESQFALADGDGTRLTQRGPWGPVRVEADLRDESGLVARWRGPGSGVRTFVADGRLRLVARTGGATWQRSAPLPQGFAPDAWHSAVLEVRGSRAYAQLSHARLGDPLATVSLRLPRALAHGGRAGAVGDLADIANLTVARPDAHRDTAYRERVPSALDRSNSDEFGGGLGAGWTWVRRDPAAQVSGGDLVWPTQAADLVGPDNQAGVLLRDAPEGDWSVATKLSIDLGVNDVRNFQQAGLIVYVTDDLFTRLSHVAIWNTRQTEFGKEMPYAGRLQFGGSIVGPPAETTWLRISHRLDPDNGEHELRAWTRTPGRRWVRGGVWTLPAGSELKVGLVSHGGSGSTARFDWFRTYR